MPKSKYDNEWMARLRANLLIMQDAEPKGMRKLVLHDARETIDFLLGELAKVEAVDAIKD